MTTTDETEVKMPPWDRYCHLMECRAFNHLAGSDPAGRRWERDHGREIEQLETANPGFVVAYCQRAVENMKAAAPVALRKPRGLRPGQQDNKMRQTNDG